MAIESSAATAGEPAPGCADDLAYDVFARECPSREALKHITDRWGSLTLGALLDGTFRFNELRRRVEGVSEKMLAQTLHALERDGLVHREAQQSNPPRVDYALTPLGNQVARQLRLLIDLVEDRMPQVLQAREHYDARHSAG